MDLIIRKFRNADAHKIVPLLNKNLLEVNSNDDPINQMKKQIAEFTSKVILEP